MNCDGEGLRSGAACTVSETGMLSGLFPTPGAVTRTRAVYVPGSSPSGLTEILRDEPSPLRTSQSPDGIEVLKLRDWAPEILSICEPGGGPSIVYVKLSEEG